MAKVPRRVWLLGFVSLFNDISSEMLYPVMPIFLTTVLAAPVFVIGIIEGIAEGISAIFKTLFGVWSDKLQKRKPFVVAGYASSAISKIIIAVSASWPTVLLGRVTDRFGKGLRTGARDALLLETTTDSNKGFIFGIHRTMDSMGAVIGPLIAVLLLTAFHNDIRQILYVAAVPSFLGLLFFFFISDTKKTVQTTKTRLSFDIKKLSPQLKLFLLVFAVFSVGNSSDAFLILRAKNIGMSLSLVILAYTLYNFFYAAFSTPAGKLADKIGAKKVFIVGLILFAFVYAAFGFNSSQLFVWPLFAIYGVYIAFTDGVSKALIGSLVPPEEAGTAYGVLQTIVSVGTLLASVIGGFLWSAISPSATFLFGALCSLLALVIFIFSPMLSRMKSVTL